MHCLVATSVVGMFKNKREVAAMEKRVDMNSRRIVEDLCKVGAFDGD